MANYTRMGVPYHYIGAAADVKPTGVPIGSRSYEYDTNKWYVTYDGSTWVEMQDLNALVLGAGTAAIGKLVANSGVDIGDVDVLSIAAGSNLIGKVSEPAVVETPFTGTGDLVVGTNKIAPGAAFRLTEIELHLSAAPTTGTQNLVITLDDGVAAAYDVVILTLGLVANAVTDLVIKPNKLCKAADVITAAWTNTDTRTYGLKFKHQLI